jgi:hypothetical protein
MSRSRHLYGSLGIGELFTAKAALLLLLGAVVATAAVIYGNAYASHGHVEEEEAEHAEEEGEGGEAAEEEEEHAEEEEADEGSRSLKVTESILISTAGAGLIPLGLLLARRRTRSGEELTPLHEPEAAAGPPEPVIEAGAGPVLRPVLALLSMGAAVIHFVVVPGHWDEYWGQGLFFIIAAIAQLLWAVWVVIAPSRLLYLLGALGNAAIVTLWIVTRTYGIPAGPSAGEEEAVEFADTLATVFEVLLVVGALVLARSAPARPVRWPTGALGVTALAALVLAGLTAASLMTLAEV